MAVRIKAFIKKEVTLCVSFAAALISCFFVPPDRAYLGYFDLRTLALLYCLMVVVAGLRGAGVFRVLAHGLCKRANTVRALSLVLVALSFLSSMLITNDVAILTFVPLALTVLSAANQERALAWVVTLQCIGANLGSMLTPVGNPQNLYLYSYYSMNAGAFFSATAPVWLASAALLFCLCMLLRRDAVCAVPDDAPDFAAKKLAVYLALLALCMLVVFRVLRWPYMLGLVIVTLLVFERRMLLSADFCLLLTFACFFVFAGNLARIGSIDAWIRALLSGHELYIAAAVSQFISNVPAAILLSGFTGEARALLLGVNIGGLGTPIASLASLIALKLYARAEGTSMKRFLPLFLGANAALLALLLLLGSALM